MNIRPLEVELLHADGRTDMTKQTVAILRTRLNASDDMSGNSYYQTS
jgi:hypothetical protein